MTKKHRVFSKECRIKAILLADEIGDKDAAKELDLRTDYLRRWREKMGIGKKPISKESKTITDSLNTNITKINEEGSADLNEILLLKEEVVQARRLLAKKEANLEKQTKHFQNKYL